VRAIKLTETGIREDCESIKGMSGEIGCYQYMHATFKEQARKYVGYELKPTKINMEYIVTLDVQSKLDKGMSVNTISLKHNAGNGAIKCSSGVNRWLVKYDSCKYVEKLKTNYLTLK